MGVAKIGWDVSHQTWHKVLGHHVARNITKFQSCRHDNLVFIGKNPPQKHFEKNNITVVIITTIGLFI